MAIWRITNRIVGPGEGGNKFNIFHVRRDTTGPDGNAFIEDLEAFYNAMSDVYPSGTTVTIGESIVDVESQEFVESTPVDVSLGTVGSNPAPELLQVVIPWRTSVRARRGMGRTFVGPLATSMMSSGNPNPSQLAKIASAADGLVAESEGTVLGAFGVYGYEQPKTPNQPRGDDEPRVLRDIIGRGQLRTNGFSYLSSRRD